MPRAQIEHLRGALPNASVFIMYGQTEATARLTYLPPAMLEAKLGSGGLPLPGVEIEIRASDGRVLPAGEVGEICARGPNVMLGYWRDPELTAEVLRDGWLHTGDLGHRDADGYLFIDGRAAEMIKVGAFRVSPQEVEEVLPACPGVEEAAATSIAVELLGQAVKAVVVLRDGAAIDARAIKAHCRQHLAAYKVPKVVEILANYLEKNFPGATYYSAYEAGFCGFSVHRDLVKHGINNKVVNPADIPTKDKEKKQKEDKRDSRKITKSLRNGDIEGIYVPSKSMVELRGLVRYRKTIVKEISRNKNRIKSYLYLNGIEIPPSLDTASEHWSGKFTQWLRTIEMSTSYGNMVLRETLDTTEHLRVKLLKINNRSRYADLDCQFVHQGRVRADVKFANLNGQSPSCTI